MAGALPGRFLQGTGRSPVYQCTGRTISYITLPQCSNTNSTFTSNSKLKSRWKTRESCLLTPQSTTVAGAKQISSRQPAPVSAMTNRSGSRELNLSIRRSSALLFEPFFAICSKCTLYAASMRDATLTAPLTSCHVCSSCRWTGRECGGACACACAAGCQNKANAVPGRTGQPATGEASVQQFMRGDVEVVVVVGALRFSRKQSKVFVNYQS